MELVELTVREFMDELASSSPAPGGGSVAAVEAAYGASLLAMVCNLTLGRKKYADYQELAAETEKKAQNLKEILLLLVDEDTAAYNLVSAAYKLPKETDEEKVYRKTRIQAGLKESCQPPLKVMNLSMQCLDLLKATWGYLNQSCMSDLYVAVASLKTGLNGAYANVLINLSGIEDQRYVTETKEKIGKEAEEYNSLADSLMEELFARLG